MHTAVLIISVFVSCCCNVIFLELIITDCPGSGNIIIFFQFLFISLKGFVCTSKFGKVPRSVPLHCYVMMTVLYSVNVGFQNVLLYLNVDIPLLQLLRSLYRAEPYLPVELIQLFHGSLIASLLLGVLMLRKRYRWSKYFSVALISLGITTATLASTSSVMQWHAAIIGGTSSQLYSLLFGLCVLTLYFGTSALLGIYQELVFSRYGNHATEAVFYSHMLPLPLFLLFSKEITTYMYLFSKSEPVPVPVINVSVPRLWIYLIFNVITQYVCISSVFTLTAECSSLTVNLVVTLRKFTSLLFSVIYFNNAFTVLHWTAAVLVFFGTLLFSDDISSYVITKTVQQLNHKQKIS